MNKLLTKKRVMQIFRIIFLGWLGLVITMLITGCEEGFSGEPLTSTAGNNEETKLTKIAFTLDGKEYATSPSGNSGSIWVPSNKNLSALPPPVLTISEGATYFPQEQTDFSKPAKITIISKDKKTIRYFTLTVKKQTAEAKLIKIAFILDGKEYATSPSGNSGSLLVPSNANLSTLPPPVLTVSEGAIYFLQGQADFSKPVTITIISKDKKTISYFTLTVKKQTAEDESNIKTEAKLTKIAFNLDGEEYTISPSGDSGSISLSSNANLNNLPSPVLTISEGATYSPQGQTDFSKPVKITITSEDKKTSRYFTLTVEKQPAEDESNIKTEAKLTKIAFNLDGEEYTISPSGDSGSISLSSNANLNNLPSPVLTISEGATYSPQGQTDFSKPVKITITSEDKKTIRYFTLTVKKQPAEDESNIKTEAKLTKIAFNLDGEEYTISPSGNSGSILLSSNANLNNLPSPVLTISEGATYSPQGQTDFSKPVKITITSEDKKTSRYFTLTVKKQTAEDESNIKTEAKLTKIAFNLDGEEYTISPSGDSGSILLSSNADLSALPSPVLTISEGATYSPQGQTDFSKPVTITITSEDKKTIRYFTLTVEKQSAEDESNIMTEAKLTKITFTLDDKEYAISPSGDSGSILLSSNADLSALPSPVLTISKGATYSPQGQTDFSKPVKITITSEDQKTSRYFTLMVEKQSAEDEDKITQASYTKEEDGGPARPTWIDMFRHYPEASFLKKGRYILAWKKDPGSPGPKLDYNPADRWEMHQIKFKDPRAMTDDSKFGKDIDPNDIKEIKVIARGEVIAPMEEDETIPLPANLLPPTPISTDESKNYAARDLWLAKHSQYGYVAVDAVTIFSPVVVAYKVRLFRHITKLNDDGDGYVKEEVYNDGQVVFVNRESGSYSFVGATGGGASAGGGSVSEELVPDEIDSMEKLRTKLGIPAGEFFTSAWESRRTNPTAIESLLSKEQYETLFTNRKNAHDPEGTYYTYENFVRASSYFPKFLGEGTEKDKYRELAAFFGNKGQEIGQVKGSAQQAEGNTRERYNHGIAFIVEISALAGVVANGENIENQADLYKGYSINYTQAGHADYPPVKGKSYHGRGPVQLSWNYNYGAMSEALFGDKQVLLENPNMIARNGVLGWASALWFWMQPQGNKPSAHDVMVGNVDLADDVDGVTYPELRPRYTDPNTDDDDNPFTNPDRKLEKKYMRPHTKDSKGHDAAGNPVDYSALQSYAGLEVGFGMTINIINGGLEANLGIFGQKDSRVLRRNIYYAKYLEYFGKDILGGEAISPQVGGRGGDPVPEEVIELYKNWDQWYYMPTEEAGKDAQSVIPYRELPSIMLANFQNSIR